MFRLQITMLVTDDLIVIVSYDIYVLNFYIYVVLDNQTKMKNMI